MKRKLISRRDLILFALIGVLILLSVLIPKIINGGEKYVTVTIDGDTVYHDKSYLVSSYTLKLLVFKLSFSKFIFSKISEIKIENGEAYFFESDCKDKTCIKSGRLKNSGDVSACLPNKTVLSVKGEKTSFDAVTY